MESEVDPGAGRQGQSALYGQRRQLDHQTATGPDAGPPLLQGAAVPPGDGSGLARSGRGGAGPHRWSYCS